MRTYSAKPHEIERSWLLIDAAGKTLGRLATEVARRLRGKHKPQYTPHVDVGDYVIIVNADKVCVTGNKELDKRYYFHTGYTGSLKVSTFRQMREKKPVKLIEIAVKGMLPKNPLGRQMYRKLKVYVGNQHPHEAQQPQILNLTTD